MLLRLYLPVLLLLVGPLHFGLALVIGKLLLVWIDYFLIKLVGGVATLFGRQLLDGELIEDAGMVEINEDRVADLQAIFADELPGVAVKYYGVVGSLDFAKNIIDRA